MKIVEIHNLTRPLTAPLRAGYCSSFLCQLRGLTFRKQVGLEEGLLLVQNHDSRLEASIHMFFVWTDLAVVWINQALQVVDLRLAQKWRPAYVPAAPARYVLEMAPGRLPEFNLEDRIRIG